MVARARNRGLGEFTAQPDAVRGVFGLLEENIMIYLGIPGLKSLSELPSEPWVGGDYAYQVPAYHWALRTMVKGRKVNVEAEDVLKAKRLHQGGITGSIAHDSLKQSMGIKT
ncbi:MAG: hypothetical protein RXQ00_01860 [Caldivirga sp.]